nr:uncharacterized protein LOC109167108 [Ipomoea trifida]
MENSQTTMAFSVLKTLLTSLFFYADKPLILFADKCKYLQFLRYFLVSAFLFFLRLLPSLLPSPSFESYKFCLNSKRGEALCTVADGGGGEPGIARALTQVLSIVTDIPVSSRKYEVVRSLAERLIDDNLLDGNEALREVNCTALAAAFCRTLKRLESAVIDHGGSRQMDAVTATPDGGGGGVIDDYYRGLCRVVRAAKFYGDVVRRRLSARDELSRSEVSAEKLAAELLWLAQKMTACGCAEEALRRWSSAQHLAWLSLSAEPRLQGALVKVSAFLLDQARELWKEADEESVKYELRETNMNMLVSWLPLLCHASNGTDTPVLSINKRAELERTLELMINTLDEEEQEKVLSLWLQHFTYCPTSDWPNLHDSYTRWCTASRSSLLLLN